MCLQGAILHAQGAILYAWGTILRARGIILCALEYIKSQLNASWLMFSWFFRVGHNIVFWNDFAANLIAFWH